MKRHALSDQQWSWIQGLLPAERGGRGRPWNNHRRTIDGIMWVLWTGAPWRDLPAEYGPFTSVHDRLSRWAKDGTWKRIQESLLLVLYASGRLDADLWFIDGTSIRASRAAAGAGKKGGLRNLLTTPSVGHVAVTEPKSTLSAIGTAYH
jgi:transposase